VEQGWKHLRGWWRGQTAEPKPLSVQVVVRREIISARARGTATAGDLMALAFDRVSAPMWGQVSSAMGLFVQASSLVDYICWC